MEIDNMVKLGDMVKDKITGFEGLTLEKSEYLNGCIQFEVQPRIDKEGKIPESSHIDEQQLEVIKMADSNLVFIPIDSDPAITLGDDVKDSLLGFEGIAMSRSTSVSGYVQYDVQPKRDKDGKLPDSAYVSARHLKIINKKESEEVESTGGGKRNHPKRR